MKRIKALQTLSREHLSALILATCLKNGKSSNPRYPWPEQAKKQAQKVQQMWENELHWHFEAEERFFFERFQNELSESLQTVSHELVHEHREIKKMVFSLPGLNDNELSSVLSDIGKALEAHIHREEQIYFEGLQKEIATEVLETSHQELLLYYAQRPDFYCVFTDRIRHAESSEKQNFL